MKSNSKDRVVVSIIIIIFLLTISGITYFLLAPNKIGGLYTGGTLIVASNDSEQIKICNRSKASYAIKGTDDLKYYGLDPLMSSATSLQIKTEDLDKLVEGKTYWFDIRLKKADDMSTGSVAKVYTEDIMKQ